MPPTSLPPPPALPHLSPGVVVSYALSAVTAMLTAFCYAEYAAELPVAGGAFNYVSMTFGEYAAWWVCEAGKGL